MINTEIADIFDKIASYIEMSEEKNGFFRARAFRKASVIIANLPIDLNDEKFVRNPELLVAMEGIGKAIAGDIVEYIKTGKISTYETYKSESPVDLEELLQVQGLGPRKIYRLYKELGVRNMEDLKKAAETNLIAQLEGFGEKSQSNILESLSFSIVNKDKKPLYLVDPIVKELLDYMKADTNCVKIEALGSYRRCKEMVGDIDFLCISKNPEATMLHFVQYPGIDKVLSHGETKSSIWLRARIQSDIRIVPAESWGAAQQYFTGSKEHNVKLRNIAIDKGFKLSEYGLFERKTNKMVEGASEKDIYRLLDVQYPVPEIRENNGEIELGLKNKLPTLIDLTNISGDLHIHTPWSDGSNSIEEMAVYARDVMEYKYIGISDHVGQLAIAGAIPREEFKDYLADIRSADAKIDGIKIYAGVEADLDKEGNFLYPEEMLAELDYVIASIHLSTKLSPALMTKRLEKAIKNPLTKFIAHPTGRLLGKRPGYEFDFEYIFELCAQHNVALEINSSPMRLDMNDSLVRLALSKGCKIVINTDAHSLNELHNIQFGVNVARRGWLISERLFKPAW